MLIFFAADGLSGSTPAARLRDGFFWPRLALPSMSDAAERDDLAFLRVRPACLQTEAATYLFREVYVHSCLAA